MRVSDNASNAPEDETQRRARLTARFRQHANFTGRPADPEVEAREKVSLYLSKRLTEVADQQYYTLRAKLHPAKVTKAAYLEAALAFAIEHPQELEEILEERYRNR
jgi:hypothetical protein